MYSNARLSKASYKAPRSSIDVFEVGTISPALSSFFHTTAIPRHKQKTKQLLDSSMKTSHIYPTPEIYQLNPSIVPFSSFHQPRHTTPCISNAAPFTPKAPPNPKQAGTVIELPKHRPISEHVGATHHQYPTTVIGDTLLRQQAILTINGLPSLIAQLKGDIADITTARNGMVSLNKKESPPKKKRTTSQLPYQPLDYDALEQINEYQRIIRETTRILLRIKADSAEPLKDKDLIALKNLNIIDKATASMSQQQAHSKAKTAMEEFEAEINRLRPPPLI